jgi:asparagine synthase (glutamine-hydrolysing)
MTSRTPNACVIQAGAMVGMLGPAVESIATRRWQQSVARLRSRVGGTLMEFATPSLRCAYRGRVHGFCHDQRNTVMLDGSIDNLEDLFRVRCKSRVTSEAESVAKLFAMEGESLFGKLVGSFALAIACHTTGGIHVVRDRFGTRPLYYMTAGGSFAWASEIKCLTPLLDEVELDPEGLRQAIHYRYVLGHTLIAGVYQVPAAYFAKSLNERSAVIELQHWKLEFRGDSSGGSLDHWTDRTDAALDQSVARLKGSCRDVGILLSGGIDSSLLALKAARAGFRNCVALTARWRGSNPELQAAADVARHLGIEHRIVDLDDSFIRDAFPWLVWRMEEMPRHYNSFVLSKLFEAAGKGFDALLSGHAADALFGPQQAIAISRFRSVQSRLDGFPKSLRRLLARALPAYGTGRGKRWRTYLELDEHEFALRSFGLDYGPIGKLVFRERMKDPGPGRRTSDRNYLREEPATSRFQRFDIYGFNQSHLAVFDRCGAPLGATVEMPFLSPEVVAVAESVPDLLKSCDGTAKPVLKNLAARNFPREWVYRRKQGFPTATTSWLKGPLRSWLRILSEPRAANRGLMDVNALRYASADRDFEAIWSAMCLEMFCRQYLDGDGGPDSLIEGS